MRLILASQSSSRRAMLSAAGVPFDAMVPAVDEEAAKAALKQDGVEARGLADALAELKSLKLSARHPADLILGCDQVLVLADGSMLDKPRDRDEAGAQLMQMRGSVIRLISAAVISEGGTPVWRHVDVASLTMRPFSDRFLSIYLIASGRRSAAALAASGLKASASSCSRESRAIISLFSACR